ncbi:microtubule-actin cross-linking factor 1-like [Ahaetulla prasina]|uniref:microtubule-actin cross-linking factor 1-like n=1 Tax=Ahaetulla prasina TaxID=499056 RepID=UPI002647395F|nr:microtubule-actin cross-linking factor 1-like [Ahaetulla prasina]
MSSSDEETLSERSYRSERSCKSERSYRSERSGSLSPCPPGDTLPWNLPLHEQKKRKSQDSVLDPAERAVVRVAGATMPFCISCAWHSPCISSWIHEQI